MERACDILVTFYQEEDTSLKKLKSICDRVILQNIFEQEDKSTIVSETKGIVWSSTVDADFVDEDDVKDTLYGEFENNEISNVDFVYYDFDLDDKIDFAIETGMIFEDYDENFKDEDS